MAMTFTGTRNPNKALPADIRTAFAPQTYYRGYNGAVRLFGNADVVQQGEGMRGLGCDPDSEDFTGCEWLDPSVPYTPPVNTNPTPNPGTGICTPGTVDPTTGIYCPYSYDPSSGGGGGGGGGGSSTGVHVPPASGGGVDIAAITKIIQAGASTLVPILAATGSGVIYKIDPKTGAMTVYSQPAGSNVTLPVGTTLGSFAGSVGALNLSGGGFSGGTLIALAALAAVVFMSMGRGR